MILQINYLIWPEFLELFLLVLIVQYSKPSSIFDNTVDKIVLISVSLFIDLITEVKLGKVKMWLN